MEPVRSLPLASLLLTLVAPSLRSAQAPPNTMPLDPPTNLACAGTQTTTMQTWDQYWANHYDPVEGVLRILPGYLIYLDHDVLWTVAEPLNLLRVEGHLVFDKNASVPITLEAASILLTGPCANLQIGTLTDRYPGFATIRLVTDAPPPDCSSDYYLIEPDETSSDLLHEDTICALMDHGFVVEDGATLRLFGKDPYPVWTQVTDQHTIARNATSLVVDGNNNSSGPELLNWLPPGGGTAELVVASTDFDQNQAERKFFNGITDGSGLATVALTTGSMFTVSHYGEKELSASGAEWEIDERAEVAVLNRNVVVEGERLPDNPNVALEDWYPHMYFHPGTDRGNGARTPSIRLVATEFRYLGREGVEDRYPVHFHKMGDLGPAGDTKTWVVMNCSIHDTFNRGLVVHETQDLCIERNVIYKVLGHAMYFQDEMARDCLVRNNLVLKNEAMDVDYTPSPEPDGCGCTRPAIIEDEFPSSFYFVSPMNRISGNHAAGASFAGFWFDPAAATEWTVGEDENEPYFDDNVAHSCGDGGVHKRGFGVFQNTGNRRVDPTNPLALVPHTFTNSLAYKCRWHGMWIRTTGEVEVRGCKMADNRSGLYPATFGVREPGTGHFLISDCTFVGETDNVGDSSQYSLTEDGAGRSLPQPHIYAENGEEVHEERWDILSGIELYDGFNEIEKCRFANFNDLLIDPLQNQPNTGDPFPDAYRMSGAFCNVAKASAWGTDPRNEIRKDAQSNELTFVNVERELFFRDGDPRSAQVHNTLLYDPDGMLTPGPTDTAGYFIPDGQRETTAATTTFLVEGITSAVFENNLYGQEGRNGWWVPDSAVDYAQVSLRVNEAVDANGSDINFHPNMNPSDDPNYLLVKRKFDPAGSPTLGETYACSIIFEQDERLVPKFIFNLSTGTDYQAANVDQHYYTAEMVTDPTMNPPLTDVFPSVMRINYYFAEREGEVIYLEVPVKKNGPLLITSALHMTLVQENSDDDVIQSTAENAYFYDVTAGRLYLKLTAENDPNSLTPATDGTFNWVAVDLR
ncbi:MAG: hypothetical protein EYC70_01190 [Planctomycetota bacterium]|nr:MAG: hypothetical protein EYC70_01190 [Planctomycetota bacterium]